jgi:hypothetical protein
MVRRYQGTPFAVCALSFFAVATALWAGSDKDIEPSLLGTYASGVPSTADTVNNPNELPGSEIAGFDRQTKRLFITNAFNRTIDIISIANPSLPSFVTIMDLTPFDAFANSVDLPDFFGPIITGEWRQPGRSFVN